MHGRSFPHYADVFPLTGDTDGACGVRRGIGDEHTSAPAPRHNGERLEYTDHGSRLALRADAPCFDTSGDDASASNGCGRYDDTDDEQGNGGADKRGSGDASRDRNRHCIPCGTGKESRARHSDHRFQ